MTKKEQGVNVQNELLKILQSFKTGHNVKKNTEKLTKLLEYIDEKQINKYITKIQQMLLIEHDTDIVKNYSKIVQYYRSYSMFDAFFDFYWLNRKENLADEIVDMYKIFGSYYYKYYKEMKGIAKFEEIVNDLEDKVNKIMNKHKN